MKKLLVIATLLGTLTLTGCAHPIKINPQLDELAQADVAKVDKSVAYYISREDREREVTTPGGGGDMVSYRPYADLETGIYKVLTTKYSQVYLLKDPADKAFLAEKGISYVFLPKITTNSSSNSAFTWPPTTFEITMDCSVTDPAGTQLWQRQVGGMGEATFSEFKYDFGLAAHRAGKDVLTSLQHVVNTAPELQ